MHRSEILYIILIVVCIMNAIMADMLLYTLVDQLKTNQIQTFTQYF